YASHSISAGCLPGQRLILRRIQPHVVSNDKFLFVSRRDENVLQIIADRTIRTLLRRKLLAELAQRLFVGRSFLILIYVRPIQAVQFLETHIGVVLRSRRGTLPATGRDRARQ